VPLVRADKSKFLARAGYSIENAQQLMADLRSQILPLDAFPAGTTKFGEFFEIRGALLGPNGVSLRVRTIWIREHLPGTTRFVTLLLDKSKTRNSSYTRTRSDL
jgi:hypothetical protein